MKTLNELPAVSDTLAGIIVEQSSSLQTLAKELQVAERRGWGMFILGLIVGFAVAYNVR